MVDQMAPTLGRQGDVGKDKKSSNTSHNDTRVNLRTQESGVCLLNQCIKVLYSPCKTTSLCYLRQMQRDGSTFDLLVLAYRCRAKQSIRITCFVDVSFHIGSLFRRWFYPSTISGDPGSHALYFLSPILHMPTTEP